MKSPVQARPARCLADVIMASSSVPRPVRRRGVSQSLRFVQVEVKQVDRPGKLRKRWSRGAVGAAEEGETKRRGKGRQ